MKIPKGKVRFLVHTSVHHTTHVFDFDIEIP